MVIRHKVRSDRSKPRVEEDVGADALEIVSGVGAGDVVVADGNAGITEGMPLAPAVAAPAADAGS